ncbi:hypothetical protein [Natrialba taiwanensis]|uniref:DUF7995 domain-containing protein n=1 Tax=Natrialba taiwanensis DSM 12281 TaxID=1230458 RepID=M0A0N7_9EURY|nr:hypothetical protein [Natrialba taiwanensis]ELY91397.1 hypothetical protein C484_10831 [Natrialba taiwanensis DSM 12281]
MNYNDDDRWEFAPKDEGSIAPDATDSRAVDDGSYERVDDSLENGHVGYPDAPGSASYENGSTAENQCECGTEIAHDRTKCDFCLTTSLDYGDIAVEPDTERKLTGLIHVLIDAKTEHNAISKAKAVFKGVTGDPFTTSIDGIDECEVIADLEGELVTRFTREWGQLPGAAAVETTEGQRQLDIIRQNAGHDYTVARGDSTDNTEENRPTLDPVLFDAEGEPITDIEEVGQLIAGGTLKRTSSNWDTDEYPRRDEPTRTWIVPAIALEHVSPPDRSDETPREGRTRRNLECRSCSETTRHTFGGFDEVPVPEIPDSPIWECTRCQSPRHGPDPDNPKGDTNHH